MDFWFEYWESIFLFTFEIKILTMKKYRDNGAIGALLDEYEKVVLELKTVLNEVTPTQLITIADSETKDPDCQSIQTILTHVVRAGLGYVVYIRKNLGETIDLPTKKKLDSIAAYQTALDEMFASNEQLFFDYPNLKIEEKDNDKKILTSWGQSFDPEQLLEHAIVHILRHRRQIERFLLKLNAS